MHRLIIIIAIFVFIRLDQVRAQENVISLYEEAIYLTELGDAHVEINILISSSIDSIINIPINFAPIKNLITKLEYLDRGSHEETPPVQFNTMGSNAFIKIDCRQNDAKNLTIKMSFLVTRYINFDEVGPGEFDAYNWGYKFKNLTKFEIEKYNVKISLPQEYNYHSVTESIPIFTKKNPIPPYMFDSTNNANQLTLTANQLSFGDNAFVSFVFKSSRKSIWIIIAGGILSLLYLVFFREIIKNKQQNI